MLYGESNDGISMVAKPRQDWLDMNYNAAARCENIMGEGEWSWSVKSLIGMDQIVSEEIWPLTQPNKE